VYTSLPPLHIVVPNCAVLGYAAGARQSHNHANCPYCQSSRRSQDYVGLSGSSRVNPFNILRFDLNEAAKPACWMEEEVTAGSEET